MSEDALADSKLAAFISKLARTAKTRPDATPTLPPVKIKLVTDLTS